jgi:hypothetical protein
MFRSRYSRRTPYSFLPRGVAVVAGLLSCLGGPASVSAQRTTQAPPPPPRVVSVGTPVAYDVSFSNAIHHEARVTVTFSGVPRGRALQAVMSRT